VVEAEIRVELKKGVADPEGRNVQKTLGLLGFEGIEGVSTVKVFHLRLAESDERRAMDALEQMCQKLLANPVIHNYTVRIL
jgi:phosphoribosylformylglycinamidine synthase PurS subunit